MVLGSADVVPRERTVHECMCARAQRHLVEFLKGLERDVISHLNIVHGEVHLLYDALESQCRNSSLVAMFYILKS